MATDNPSILVSDIILDAEARLSYPAISSSRYIPWISSSYIRLFNALMGCGQRVKEELFGDSGTISLDTVSPNEYTITDHISRYGGIIKVELKYGATGDEYVKAKRLDSVDSWINQDNVSSIYRQKIQPLYYIIGQKIGFIPTPPEVGAIAKIWYIKRPYQLTDTSDSIDIPYIFTYPIINYVVAKAIEREHQDYSSSSVAEAQFKTELEEVKLLAVNQYSENEGINYIKEV